MEINNSKDRIGYFTSSQIYRLCKSEGSTVYKFYKDKKDYDEGKRCTRNFNTKEEAGNASKGIDNAFILECKPELPKSFNTYAEEVYYEKLMGRSIKTEVKTRPMLWGSLMEVVLFNLLGLDYKMTHKATMKHPVYSSFWSGTADLIVPEIKTGEIKCFEPNHFCKLSLALLSKDIEVIKAKEPEAYWQATSNSLIHGFSKTEIIAYMPYKSELKEIITLIEDTNFLEKNGLNPYDYYFMTQDNIESMPYLPDDSKMSNINSFEFEIPKLDALFCENRVVEARCKVKELLKSSQK